MHTIFKSPKTNSIVQADKLKHLLPGINKGCGIIKYSVGNNNY